MGKNFKDDQKWLSYFLVFFFSLATPSGIGVGMAVADASPIVNVVFFSLAGGNFLYVACSKVIIEEFSTPEFKWWKMFTFLLGATLVTCLKFIDF
jgi:hypothetical protein